MVAFTILAGGYDVFLAAYLFNATASTLSLVNKFPTGPSPSWITFHPTNRSILYAVNEDTKGAIQSFVVSPQGTVSNALSTVSSGGNGPAFAAALSTGEVAVFNYGSGNGRIVQTTSNSPVTFTDSAPVIAFPAPALPQVSHPHQAVEHNGEVLVPDLGGDKIWRLARTGGPGSYSIQGFISQPSGSGPRHLAIFNDRIFTLHEVSSTLSLQTIPTAPNGTSNVITTVTITPPNPPAGAKFAAAEILIPPATSRFPTSYIYVSNRNVGVQDPRGDTIAIYKHVNKGQSNEGLVLVNQVYTGLNQPRGVVIGPESSGADEFLVAAGVQGTAGVKVFRRTEGGRNLALVAQNTQVATRTTFAWV